MNIYSGRVVSSMLYTSANSTTGSSPMVAEKRTFSTLSVRAVEVGQKFHMTVGLFCTRVFEILSSKPYRNLLGEDDFLIA